MIAIIKGTVVHTVTSVLLKLSRRRRYQVREITLDLSLIHISNISIRISLSLHPFFKVFNK